MKQVFMLLLCLDVLGNSYSQGITLLYKGGGLGWNDPVNWIQINTPTGQPPIQRVPTELDDVVFSGTQSGLSTVSISFDNFLDTLTVGGSSETGLRCRSMHVSNTDLYLSENSFTSTLTIDVYTTNSGSILIDSGSNFRYGHLLLHGGNPEINDLEILNSTFGSLFSHNDWSTVQLATNGKARFIKSILGGHLFAGGGTGSNLYADNCTFNTTSFTVSDHAAATILNSTVQNDGNNVYMLFHIGRNASFVSSNVTIKSYASIDFYTSGSVLNGNVSIVPGVSLNELDFTQEDPANPLPNIINGDLFLGETQTMGISGNVKISGNWISSSNNLLMYVDTSHVFINAEDVFKIGGIINYGNNVAVTNCVQDIYCHFTLEFFGNSNSNIGWPIGFPVDTLVINKTGCAKVSVANSLYVSGATRILGGQLTLDPNEGIPYKFVCAGDVEISEGGGIFLRKNANGLVASIAVAGSLLDNNTATDTSCTGLTNPYYGTISLYRETQNAGNKMISVKSASNIGNLNLIGATGSGFMMNSDLHVNNFSFNNSLELLLGDHNLVVTGDIFNY